MAKELFGQFLIRRGKVNQEDIEEALVLQEILSDSLGAAALANDMITFGQVGQILDYMDNSGSTFTDAALELKFLTRAQIEVLAREAAECQFRLGQLLVATTKLLQPELEDELVTFHSERQLIPSPNVTKAGLVARVAQKSGMDNGSVQKVLESILSCISSEMASGGSIVIKGFGTFSTVEHAARDGRNPRSGESIKIRRKRVPQLRFARSLKERVS